MLCLLMLCFPAQAEGKLPTCADGPHAENWEAVLRYGTPVLSKHRYPGPTRRADDIWYVWVTFRKRLFVFISKPWGAPGAVEQNAGSIAWHGQCVLSLGTFD